MLYMITGLPGHGKTLNTIKFIKENPDFEGREVFYNGIPELSYDDWHEFEDADKWYDLPDGAVIIIDECQRVFPVTRAGSDVPQKIREFETHRHHGWDVFLLTQDPMLAHSHVRRLVGKHIHFFRPMNGRMITRYQWDQIANPKDYHDKKQADSQVIKLDKKYFGVYKSTVLNTHKFKLPKKLLLLPLVIGLVIYCVYFIFSFLQSKQNPDEASTDSSTLEQIHDQTYIPSSAKDQIKNAPVYSNPYEPSLYQPRLINRPDTAPIYDSLFNVVSKPDIHCISNNNLKCLCYDQQMIKYQMDWQSCKAVMAGSFDPSKPDPDYSLKEVLSEPTERQESQVPEISLL